MFLFGRITKKPTHSKIYQCAKYLFSFSLDFQEPPMTLSPCKDTWSIEEKLLWLQPRRDVGMWIQCCRKNCKKWRYCDDFHDPVVVPKIWYCKMNSSTYPLLHHVYVDIHINQCRHSVDNECVRFGRSCAISVTLSSFRNNEQ